MRRWPAAVVACAGVFLLAGCAGADGRRAEPDSRGRSPTPASSHARTPHRDSLPPVVDHVPTRDRVVFLTYDDGAGRDPLFAALVRERRLPVSLFLTDTVAGPGYGHFARLRAVGASIQNHTLNHPALRGLPYAGQRAEICGQQHGLRSRFGIRPHLLRPPHGTYDTTTLSAAADCGITAVVLWRASLGADGDLTYTRGAPALRPGDIVSVPSDGFTPLTLTERTARLLREIEERGLRVGRLEDHL
ncbi:polysaccharide deacetylase family protein [Streptomyces sp. NRRL S-474]|uniref:polysaccharide deacetylase family protein n=1 Tax=Streptomyces sp. NRRL S-474 TaxID=1463909 RepID=UPI0004C8249F|nr:polysaccharide deacetylase family protein [Streptomyces sp. NRRL S-474]